MDLGNRTVVTELILLGFSKDLMINIVLFILFLVIYLITVVGNVLIIFVIFLNPHLQTPMYFFLCVLSFVDLCNSTSVVPKLLSDLFSVYRSISVSACALQFYIILLMGGTECQLLALMAYDRYTAICRPLHYPVLMRWSVCCRLTAMVWIMSFVAFILPSLLTPSELCYPNQMNHFMCELLVVIKLTCIRSKSGDFLMFLICALSVLLPFLFIIVSYVCILSSVLKMRSAARSKAFSTCTSHIIVVIFFYGPVIVMYFGQASRRITDQGKYLSTCYNVICPMLNPLVYSLKNTVVKEKIKQLLKRCISSFSGLIGYTRLLGSVQR